jgi:hypothetical protein
MGYTAFHRAVMDGQVENVACVLKSERVDPNFQISTPCSERRIRKVMTGKWQGYFAN